MRVCNEIIARKFSPGEIHSLAWIPPMTNMAGLFPHPPLQILATLMSLPSKDLPMDSVLRYSYFPKQYKGAAVFAIKCPSKF